MSKAIDFSWLEAYQSPEPHFGLERMETLLSYLGSPHKSLEVIHIAGTNGKGSTIAHLSTLLEQQGLRVARFTSPYLVDFREQFSINQDMISEQKLQDLLEDLKQVIASHAEELQGLTEFEILTALAFVYFHLEEVDVAIFEVGMGGDLDSTNVCQPLLTAITTIGLDHTALLGSTLAQIAGHKAGIIKQGVPVFEGGLDPEASQVVEAVARGQKAPLSRLGRDFAYELSSSDGAQGYQAFTYRSRDREPFLLRTPLLGTHQAANASLALALADAYSLIKKRSLLEASQVQAAFERVIWPGRMEKVSTSPLVYLDGAHNPHAVEELRKTLSQHFAQKKVRLLFTCIQTKALDEMLDLLSQDFGSDLILTHFEDPRATKIQVLQQAGSQRGLDFVPWKSYLDDYLDHPHHEEEVLLITGSLYFLSQVRPYILQKNKRK